MAKRKAPAAGPTPTAAASRTQTFTRRFLPSLDLVDAVASRVEELSDDDKRQVIGTKIADITHFRVGLDSLQRHVFVAREMAAEVRPLPRQVRGVVVNPGGAPAVRISVQPTMPGGGAKLGRGVVTDELGVFALPLPPVPDEQRALIARRASACVSRDEAMPSSSSRCRCRTQARRHWASSRSAPRSSRFPKASSAR
jgi:hypothetical protein